MSERFDLNKLTQDPAFVAGVAPAEELFGFFTRELPIPHSCVALVYGNGHQPVLQSPGRTIEAGEIREVLFVRAVAFQLEYSFINIASSDGFPFDATVQIAVQAMPERVDLESFRQSVLGSRREARLEKLRQHCEDAVRGAVESFIRSHTAEALALSTTWDGFDPVLTEEFKPLGFSSGLALGRDPRIALRSAMYEDSRQEARSAAMKAQRDQQETQRRQAAAKARESHMAEIAGLVERVKSMTSAGGGINVTEIVRTFDVGQRGQLYHGLLAGGQADGQTRFLLVVAGGDLLWIDATNLQQPMRKQPLPTEAGALRSVRVVDGPDGRMILVGARHGVHGMTETGDHVQTFVFTPKSEIRGGVNAATTTANMIFATHSEAGLLRWKMADPAAMQVCLPDFTEGSKSVRDVQTDSAGRLWLAIDNLAIGWRPGDESPQFAHSAPGEITALVTADGHAVAGLRDGSVVRWLIGDPKVKAETVRPAMGKPVQSIEWIAGGGVPRLLVGDGRPHLDLLVLGDSYTAQYRSLHELRWGFAADDLIAAVNDRRDHLFVWSPDSPDLPRGALAVGRITGRSIQDVALL